MPTKREDKLIEQWIEATPDNHRRCAEIEYALFAIERGRTGPGGGKGRRRSYLCDLLGGGPQHYDVHATLWRAGDVAEPLWDALATGAISLTRAQVLLRKHGREPNARQRIAEALGFVTPEPSATGTNALPALTKALQSRLREQVTAYMAEALAGVGSVQADACRDRFMGSLELLFEDLRRDVVRERKNAKPALRVTRGKFEDACLTLSISADYGKTIDQKRLDKARKRQWFELHPDRNEGNGDTTVLQEITDAYELLVEYNEQCSKRGQ